MSFNFFNGYRVKLFFGIILFLPYFFSGSVFARELKFITIDVAPWASINPETHEPEGEFVDVVKEIEKRSGYDISISLTPFARVDREMESGGHDCTILIPRSDDFVVQGELVSYHEIGVVPARGKEIESYEQLAGMRLSLLRGSTITDRFDNDSDLKKIYDTDYLMALRKLARNRVDAVVGAIPTIVFLAKQNNISRYLGKPLKLAEVPLNFQCSKKSKNLDVMPKINNIIKVIKDENIIKAIQKKYYF